MLAWVAGLGIGSARAEADAAAVEMIVGSPPMVSDDTGTPGPGGIEVNLILGAELERDARSWEVPALDLNFGIGERTQLTFELPYAIEEADVPGGGRVTERGLGALETGIKYRFYERDGLSFAIFPKVLLRLTPALGDASSTLVLPVLVTREFDSCAITANLGVELPRGEQAGWFGSFGAGTRLSSRLALLAEVAGTDLQEPDQRRVALDLGLRWRGDARHVFALALGRDVHAGGDQQLRTTVTLTAQWLFGN